VVRYFGFEEDNNFMYLALELCEVSLWSIFNDKNFSETRQRFESLERHQQFTFQLLEGIKFLHSQQIVHGNFIYHL
jgi:serine/threonine protein kinase